MNVGNIVPTQSWHDERHLETNLCSEFHAFGMFEPNAFGSTLRPPAMKVSLCGIVHLQRSVQ
eukprot:315655-Amphidinium_carterae.1